MQEVAVILTDAQRRILWVNNDFTTITGYSSAEVYGLSPGKILQGPKTDPAAVKRIREGLASGISFTDTVTNYRKNGEEYPCKLIIHPIYNVDLQLVNFLAFEVDGYRLTPEHEKIFASLEHRYKTSSLRGIEELQLYSRVKKQMTDGRVFLSSSFTLGHLSESLEVNTKYLSQVINRLSGKNFQQFINSYRVEEYKCCLESNQHLDLTFFALAQKCGFANKSTFYKVFRDQVGVTPKVYLQNLRKESSAD